MTIWVSKEALGPQECRYLSLTSKKVVNWQKKAKIQFKIFLCIFRNFLCILERYFHPTNISM